MDDSREQEEFARIHTAQEIEHIKELIAMYDQNREVYVGKLEKLNYLLGRLDQKLEV